MTTRYRRPLAVLGVAISLSACVDHVGKPLLLPVGTPAQFPQVVHVLCVGDADAAYDRQKEEFARRAQMNGPGVLPSEVGEQEGQAESAARMKYISCAASQGYRVVYN
jgi:hypothetical protein